MFHPRKKKLKRLFVFHSKYFEESNILKNYFDNIVRVDKFGMKGGQIWDDWQFMCGQIWDDWQ